MTIKKIKWEVDIWFGTEHYSASLPFGFRCSVRKVSDGWYYKIIQRVATIKEGNEKVLGVALSRCQDIWEEMVKEALE